VIYSERLSATEEGAALLSDLHRSGTALDQTSDMILESMQDVRSPQPILGLVRMRATRFVQLLAPRHRHPLVVVAHEVQDPGNLGTILRTADAAGASGLISTGASADLHHPRTVRATMGSIFRLPAIHRRDILEVIDRLQGEEIYLVAAETGSGPAPEEIDWNRKAALFLGPERGSLPEAARRQMDTGLSIPMAAGVDSLAVGAAAAVILFAARRVRSASG
jgi:TrmH family RNA methyltransferase